MKFTLIVALFIGSICFGQNVATQRIKSNIEEVKLFLTAGEMHHNQKIKLSKGRNKIVFSGISAYANPQSIQFTSDGDYRLLSVSTEMDFLAAEQFNPRISMLNDSLEELRDLKQNNEDELGAFNSELQLLNANRDIGGQNQNLTVTQLKEAATFYRTRTLEINKAISKLRKDQKLLHAQIENLRFQLVELNYHENQRSNQVIVLIDAEKSLEINSNLKYLVSDCGWAALYDLKAEDITGEIELDYKAQVYNNTGNEWNNVKLTLSTADPNLSASHPELTPWYINYYSSGKFLQRNDKKLVAMDYRKAAETTINSANERVYDNYVVNDGNMEQNQLLNEKFESDFFDIQNRGTKNQGNNQVGMRQIDISELSTEFVIAHLFSCPSDAKPYMVGVKNKKLQASFTHVTIPKLDNAAFLLANIVGWQELDLIPGPTNVYFGGAYVGVSEINTRNVSDTLSLSFGRDNKVVVMRKLKKENSEKRVIGNAKRDSYLYEIVVRNNRTSPITIDIFDQVPITTNGEITITADELSGAAYTIETGEAKWRKTLSPNGVENVLIGYTVKYPKNLNVEMQRFRTISCPSF